MAAPLHITLLKHDRICTGVWSGGLVFVPYRQAEAYATGDVLEAQVVDEAGKLPTVRLGSLVRRSEIPRYGIVRFAFSGRPGCLIYCPDAPKASFYCTDHYEVGTHVLFQAHPDGGDQERVVVLDTAGSVRSRPHDYFAAPMKAGLFSAGYSVPAGEPAAVGAHSEVPSWIGGHDRFVLGRVDLTHLEETFTVDPAGSTDLDDALSVDRLNGRIYVHIADLSTFVPPGSELDRQAAHQVCTLYLAGNTHHLFPPELVSRCSLLPGEAKRAVTVEYRVTEEGLVLARDPYRSSIRSRRALTYPEALSLLSGQPDDPLSGPLRYLREVSNKFPLQAVCLSVPVLELSVGPSGEVSSTRVERFDDEAHRLIQYYMLCANETVAKVLDARGVPFPRRCHLPPDNLDRFNELCRSNQQLPSLFGDLQVIKNLTRAFYSPEPIAHFGVGMSEYVHFTSPIRRYVDLLVHRVLLGDHLYSTAELEGLCVKATHQSAVIEQVSDWNRLIKVYDCLSRQSGPWTGVVTSVRPAGVTVRLDQWLIEVFVHVSQLRGGRLSYVDGRLVGPQGSFGVDDTLSLECSKVDLITLQATWAVPA